VQVRLAVSGCVATHSVIITEEGKAMTFGRNKFGQLGVDPTETKEIPTVVPGLENMNVIGAACGRNHTLFLTDTGTVYACGDNRSGQCGVGNLQPNILTPTRINYRGPPIVKVGCGAEFSVILDIKGGLHSFGLPEYGQLGHNTDGKYFKTNTKLCFNFETSPKRIVLYIEKSKDGHVAPVDVTEIVDFSCGQNHTVAIDSKKRAFSWGFGGFGRLGHAEQKDELVPRLIKYFDTQSKGVRSIHCGSTYSLAVTDFGALFMFGQSKRSGEANMYPKPIQDLSGWSITHVAAGNTSIIVSADESVISWGSAPTFGELGLGDFTKSSTNPKEVSRLAGVKVLGLSMGYGHTLLIAQNDTPEQIAKLETFDVFEP
jgi:alpha-tubulin suppressor-like RCC1 family protein